MVLQTLEWFHGTRRRTLEVQEDEEDEEDDEEDEEEEDEHEKDGKGDLTKDQAWKTQMSHRHCRYGIGEFSALVDKVWTPGDADARPDNGRFSEKAS